MLCLENELAGVCKDDQEDCIHPLLILIMWISKFLPFYVVAIRFAHAHYSNLNCTHCSLNGRVIRLYTRKDCDEYSASINTAPLPIWHSSLWGPTWLTSLTPRVRNEHDYACATPFAYTQYGKNMEIHSIHSMLFGLCILHENHPYYIDDNNHPLVDESRVLETSKKQILMTRITHHWMIIDYWIVHRWNHCSILENIHKLMTRIIHFWMICVSHKNHPWIDDRNHPSLDDYWIIHYWRFKNINKWMIIDDISLSVEINGQLSSKYGWFVNLAQEYGRFCTTVFIHFGSWLYLIVLMNDHVLIDNLLEIMTLTLRNFTKVTCSEIFGCL
jgi:hypothetical protein